MRRTLAALAAVLCVAGASAQTQRIELTLDKALEIALDENPTIKVADLEIVKQKYVRRETIGNHLPQIGVTGQWNHAIKKSEMAEGISFEPDNTVSASASLSLPLFAPTIYKTLKLNDEQMRAAVESARGSRLTLVNEVTKSFYGVLLAENSLAVLRESERTISETVRDTKTKYETGLASEYDYITAVVQLSNLKPTIIQTENSIEVAKKMLKMYLGLPLSVDVALSGDFKSYLAQAGTLPLPNDDVSGNSDLRMMDINVKMLQRQLGVQRSLRLPTLAAFGSASLAGQDPIEIALFPSSGGDEWRWQKPVSAGLQLSIPIFSGLTKSNREKQIKNSIQQLELQRDYLEEGINVQVQNAYNDIVTAEATMKANEVTIGQAQKGHDISKARYDGGMGTILELNSAQLNLTRAQLNLTQSVYDYLSAIADYKQLLGTNNK